MIKLVELTKRYGDFAAVDSINLEIRRGEVFGFLGPNGAGKTTTVTMITGVLKPTSGRIIIEGIDLLGDPVKAKSLIGYIPDKPFIYDKLSGMEFLLFVAGLYRMPRSEAAQKASALLEKFELSQWADELTENYSHGMKQRLVHASALLHEPHALVVDEPMVGMDPKGSRLVKGIFKELAAAGRTVFMSTHSLETAEQICDRIGIINEGRIIAVGTMEDLRKKAGTEDWKLEFIFLKLTGEEDLIDEPAHKESR